MYVNPTFEDGTYDPRYHPDEPGDNDWSEEVLEEVDEYKEYKDEEILEDEDEVRKSPPKNLPLLQKTKCNERPSLDTDLPPYCLMPFIGGRR
jgi:hypothetical protein